jgi:hypothetical protein
VSEQLDHKGYPTAPRNLKDGSWFYEQQDGLIVVIRGGVQLTIPWRKVVAAVNHNFNAKRKRR